MNEVSIDIFTLNEQILYSSDYIKMQLKSFNEKILKIKYSSQPCIISITVNYQIHRKQKVSILHGKITY